MKLESLAIVLMLFLAAPSSAQPDALQATQPTADHAEQAPSTTQADRIFLETDGAVIVEVESAPPADQWKAETEMKGFTGLCYYTWRGPDLLNQPGRGAMAYRIRIFTPGRYNLRLHNRHDFHDSTEENDVWTRIDDGKWIKTYSAWRGRWVWHSAHEHDHATKAPASFELTAGDHTFYLSGRSKNFSIDRFVLYRGGNPDAGKPLLEGPESAMLLSRIESPAVPPTPAVLADLPEISKLWEGGKLGEAYVNYLKAKGITLDQDAKDLGGPADAYAEWRVDTIRAIKDSDPLAAVAMTRQLAEQLDGVHRAPPLVKDAERLAERHTAQAASQAAVLLEQAYALAIDLPPARAAETQPALQEQRDTQLQTIREKIEQIRAGYPDTAQRWRAETLAAEFGLE